MNILLNMQAEDYVVFNSDDAVLSGLINESKVKSQVFSFGSDVNCTAYINNSFLQVTNNSIVSDFSWKNVSLIGKHNKENIADGQLFFINPVTEEIIKIIKEFDPNVSTPVEALNLIAKLKEKISE